MKIFRISRTVYTILCITVYSWYSVYCILRNFLCLCTVNTFKLRGSIPLSVFSLIVKCF